MSSFVIEYITLILGYNQMIAFPHPPGVDEALSASIPRYSNLLGKHVIPINAGLTHTQRHTNYV